MKNYRCFVILTVVLTALLAGSIQAQHGNNDILMNRLERQLQVSDELLQRAQDVVNTSANPVAVANLNAGFELQKWAKEQFQELRNQFRLELHRMAENATMKAREQAKKAVETARLVEQYEGVVQRDLEQAQEQLERAGEALRETDNQSLRAVYASAERNLSQAWEFYRKQQYRPAIKLADQVKTAARKILNAANTELRGRNIFQQRQENVSRVLQQAAERLADCGSERAAELQTQAENAFGRATEMYDQGRTLGALKQLRVARELAVKAAQQCEGVGRLQQRYEQLRRQADEIAELLPSASGQQAETARKLLEQARQQLDMAREHIAGQQVERALASLKAAQLSLRQAEQLRQQGL